MTQPSNYYLLFLQRFYDIDGPFNTYKLQRLGRLGHHLLLVVVGYLVVAELGMLALLPWLPVRQILRLFLLTNPLVLAGVLGALNHAVRKLQLNTVVVDAQHYPLELKRARRRAIGCSVVMAVFFLIASAPHSWPFGTGASLSIWLGVSVTSILAGVDRYLTLRDRVRKIG